MSLFYRHMRINVLYAVRYWEALIVSEPVIYCGHAVLSSVIFIFFSCMYVWSIDVLTNLMGTRYYNTYKCLLITKHCKYRCYDSHTANSTQNRQV